MVSTASELLFHYGKDDNAPVSYPGLDELLNDPSFQCREEWRRKLVPAQREPDEPLTFQTGHENHRQLGDGRAGVYPRAPARPMRGGGGGRPRRFMLQAAAPALQLETPRPLIGSRTLRASSLKPVRECAAQLASLTRFPSPPPAASVSQRAKEFSRLYGIYLPPPKLATTPRAAFRGDGSKVSAHEHDHSGFGMGRSGPEGDDCQHAAPELQRGAELFTSRDDRAAAVLPPLAGGAELFTSSALQAWCGFAASRQPVGRLAAARKR